MFTYFEVCGRFVEEFGMRKAEGGMGKSEFGLTKPETRNAQT
jgi:hypothetical protein